MARPWGGARSGRRDGDEVAKIDLGSFARRAGRVLVALVLLAGAHALPAAAETAAPAPDGDVPPKVRELLNLLADPGVQRWLDAHRGGAVATETEQTGETMSAGGYLAARLAALRQNFADLVAALPDLPDQLERVGIILGLEFEEHGVFAVLFLIAGFVALGYGMAGLYSLAARRIRQWIVTLPLDTVQDRLRAVLVRFAYAIGMVAAFAVGSIGAFLLLAWPPLLREIGLGYLVAFLALRLTLVAGRFVLAPGGERFRILPMSTPAAYFWLYRLGLAVGWFAFGWVTISLLATLGLPLEHRRFIAYALGLVLLAIGLEMVWRRPRPAEPAEGPAAGRRHSHHAGAWLMSAYFVLLWALWVAGAGPVFWLAVAVVGLPAAIGATQRAVHHILRPTDAPPADASAAAAAEAPSIHAVYLERGLRTVLIIGAALLLARAWHIDLIELTATDTASTKLLRGIITAVVIVLLADLGWRVLRAMIDRKLTEAQTAGKLEGEEARRRARLLTLLPILKNMLFIVLLVIVALMVLSSVGVEIGPLIAGAGVVGVAVGFGAQTLVKDIISGMFYLLDDAFRVGEYIQSGNYKGKVESFSLRSVKLRHHRGPLFTIPFGALGAIQNMSRDWVIDKLSIGVTYDTDLDKAKKLIKQIGKELLDNPEFAPNILETLKMQGVEKFGDYAIQIRMKMMTKPGEQFVIRRRAYALIKKSFDANGIKFAFPTVQVAGGDDASAAVARQGLELVQPAPPSTAAS
jgi:small-conductance mechanosensitive channel